jgi:hypothetical protein
MLTYSAAEAISPAVQRTREFLFHPFRWGRFLKLALVAALVEGSASSFNFNFPSNLGGGHGGGTDTHPWHWPAWHMPSMPVVIAVVAVVLVVAIPLSLLIAYLLIRLRFSYFECVMLRRDQIGPAWNRYHRQSVRLLGLSLCLGLGFWAVLGVEAYYLWQRYKPLLLTLGTDTPTAFVEFLPLIGIGLVSLLVLGLAGVLLDTFLRYFVLPHMALEDASIGDAVNDAWAAVAMEPGQFLLFLILRILLPIVAAIGGFILMLVPILVVAILGVIVGLILHDVAGPLALFLGMPAIVLVALLFLAMGVAIGGTIGTFMRTWSMLFYGGRYPALGSLLWPQPPPIAPIPPLGPQS